MFGYLNSNETKKLSWGGNYGIGTGGVFNRKRFDYGMYGKVRFNSKFSYFFYTTYEVTCFKCDLGL